MQVTSLLLPHKLMLLCRGGLQRHEPAAATLDPMPVLLTCQHLWQQSQESPLADMTSL